jgi:amidohydrolase
LEGNEMKEKVAKEVVRRMPELIGISKYIYDNPELAFLEKKASSLLCNYLERNGFSLERGVGGLETSFRAIFKHGKKKTNIGIVAEYDALPGLGHGCGHNLIAASAVGTAAVLRYIMEDENIEGQVTVIGTPAEEDGGGKIILIEKGVFDELSSCMMMHPTSAVTRIAGTCLSSHGIDLRWRGKSAHAESHPEKGVNALDALHVYYAASSCLRQQLPDDVRIAQVVTSGGKSAGMIPDDTGMSVDIVSEDENLDSTVKKIKKCAEGAAVATGCKVEIKDITGYLGRIPNHTLEKVFRENFRIIGEPLMEGMPADFGTTDFGNVTRIMPCCNPYVSLLPERKITNHSLQFKELAISKRSEEVIKISVKAMAYSALDLLIYDNILVEAWQEFEDTVGMRK